MSVALLLVNWSLLHAISSALILTLLNIAKELVAENLTQAQALMQEATTDALDSNWFWNWRALAISLSGCQLLRLVRNSFLPGTMPIVLTCSQYLFLDFIASYLQILGLKRSRPSTVYNAVHGRKHFRFNTRQCRHACPLFINLPFDQD